MDNKEIQSRREFFKSAAMKALPVVGAIALSQVTFVSNAHESHKAMGCDNDCNGGCQEGCYTGCRYACSTSCKGGCQNSCDGGCMGDCYGSCRSSSSH